MLNSDVGLERFELSTFRFLPSYQSNALTTPLWRSKLSYRPMCRSLLQGDYLTLKILSQIRRVLNQVLKTEVCAHIWLRFSWKRSNFLPNS